MKKRGLLLGCGGGALLFALGLLLARRVPDPLSMGVILAGILLTGITAIAYLSRHSGYVCPQCGARFSERWLAARAVEGTCPCPNCGTLVPVDLSAHRRK